MADSLSPTSPEYINVNCDSKPDTSKFNKDLSFNKDNVNQNKGFPSKCSSSDKFKNSPLLPDKKHLLSPRSSPQPRRVSPSQPEQKVINSPPPVVEQFISPPPVKEEKIINSPRSARSSVTNSQEFRIVNPTSRSASVSSQVESPLHSSQDFLVKRDRSQSDNDSLGDAEILELLSDDATEEPPVDKAVNSGNLDDVFGDTGNSTSEAVNVSSETIHLNTENDENSAYQITDEIGMNNGNDLHHNEDELWMNNSNDMMLINDDLLDETIAELQLIEAEGLADVSYDKDIHGPIEIIQNRSSTQFDTEEALSGLLEIAEMADDFGLTDDSVDDMSQVMSVWIEESIDNLKDMLKRTIQRPTSKRKNTTAPNNSRLSKLQNPAKVIPQKQAVALNQKQAAVSDQKQAAVSDQKQAAVSDQKQAAVSDQKQAAVSDQKPAVVLDQKPAVAANQKQPMKPNPKQAMTPRRQTMTPDLQRVMTPNRSKIQAPKTIKTPSTASVKTCPDSQYVENSDSPLSRFSQPSTFEKRLAAKLTLESLKDQGETSPTPNQEGGRRKPKPISQSESGDFTGSSRASPSGEYGSSFNSGSNFNSEPPSRSYTPSYNESFTPSDASDNSDTESSPEHFVPTGIRKPGSSATRGLPTRGGQRTGVRGRATGVRRVRPSYSGEHLGGLVESSSAESFVSNKSEDPGDHPRGGSLSGLRKPTATSTPRGLARPRPVNTATLPRPSNLGIQSPRKQNSPQPPKSNIAKPSGLQKMKPSGLQKPGAARAIPKPSGIARGAAKSARGAGRPGLKKPATSKGSWDEGCY